MIYSIFWTERERVSPPPLLCHCVNFVVYVNLRAPIELNYCELAQGSLDSRKRESSCTMWGLELEVSRKLSIFDIWCLEQKNFCFHLSIKGTS